MQINRLWKVLLITFAMGIGVVAQDTPGNLRDLVGVRASNGENQLRGRGYTFVKTATGDDRKWSNWWNNYSRICVTVATVDGRYESIMTSPAEDCNRRTNNNGNWNSGGSNNGGWNNGNNNNWGWGGGKPNGVPGLGKPGVTVYDDRNFRGTSQSFGVGRYLNGSGQFGSLRNDEASSVVVLNGYKVRFCENEGNGNGSGKCDEYGAGSYNLRLNDEASYIEVTRVYGGGNWGNNNSGGSWGNNDNWNGGNGGSASLYGLNGLSLYNGSVEMVRRGFRQVHVSGVGNTKYVIYWRSSSSQCVQVTVAGGRYESVNDIGSHPRCR